ncbi:MAG TPA: serine/threonine-protein kinase [Polyangiaceae bacterium]|nr:serine/threonine-protein kinase [Polyangiaceae bacterium]
MDFSEPWGPGHVIANKYRLVRQLGKGGMGSVWAADHLALSSQVAVKIIDPSIAKNEEALARFLREAQAAAALRSPHVVQTFDYGVHESVPFIAMELLEGESLAQRLDVVKQLPLDETARVLTQVGRAIARAHEAGIVHRDLKPDNIFLVKNDDEEIAKVLDFGIAKATGGALGNSSQTRTGAILGTPYYMSPEQAEGNRSVDHRTDLWSLAIIAFECVTGKRPFESDALGDLILQICVRPIKMPSTVAPVPPAFDAWYATATQRDPAQRFQSARELTIALRAAAGLAADMGKGRPTLPSTNEVLKIPPPPPVALTPSGALDAQTPQRPFNVTTGGAGSVTNDEPVQVPKQASTPLLVGATLAALALAGTVAFFVFRSKGHDDAAQAHATTAAQVTAAAAAPAPPTEEPPAKPAAVATATPVATVEPAAAAHVAEPAASAVPVTPEAAPAEHVAETSAHKAAAAVRPAKATASAAKKADKPASSPAPKQRVDFGF